MRVISLVPSWTETLIRCGVNVVGRTRFCIHPQSEVQQIQIVGGTKDIDWDKVKALSADLLILDQEENPKAMAEESPLPYFATHVKSVSDMPDECQRLADKLQSRTLARLSERWVQIVNTKGSAKSLSEIPGIIEWLKPTTPLIENFIYIIWKSPWMAVSPNTFIGSVFKKLDFGSMMIDFDQPYPKINLEDFDPHKTLLLFSSEPFPFERKKSELINLPFCSALIDGESYSWFGTRSLEFLEKNLIPGSR